MTERRYNLGQFVRWQNAVGHYGDGIIKEARYDGERWHYLISGVWVTEECINFANEMLQKFSCPKCGSVYGNGQQLMWDCCVKAYHESVAVLHSHVVGVHDEPLPQSEIVKAKAMLAYLNVLAEHNAEVRQMIADVVSKHLAT